MSIESPYSSLMSDSCTSGTMLPCAVCTGTAATIPSSRASVLYNALDLSPRWLGNEGLCLRLAGEVLLHVPTSFFPCNRPGGASRVALTGLNFDVRPGGAVRAAPTSFPHGVSLSGYFNTALADVASILMCSSLLGRLGPSSHCLPQLRGLRHEVHGRQGLRRPVRRTACPGLEGLGWGERDRIPGNGPGAENRGTKVEDNRIGKSIEQTTGTKSKSTYSDRALILRLPVSLLRARGTAPPLEDCPEGAALGSAWSLGAVSTGVSAPAADSLPQINTRGAGVSSPAAGGGDSRSAPSRDGSANDSVAVLVSPGAAGAPLSTSH